MNFSIKITEKIKSVSRTLKLLYDEFVDFKKGMPAATEDEKSFGEFLKGIKLQYPNVSNKGDILLVPLIDDIGTMKLITEYAFKIASEQALCIRYFYVHTAIDQPINLIQIFQKINYWKTYFLNGSKRLRLIYGIKRKDIIVSNYFKLSKHANHKKFEDKNALVDLKLKNIVVGDLIYDTYLRFRNKPTVDLLDPSLYDILAYSNTLMDKWRHVFSKYKVKKILTPYSTYIHWGIPVRVGLDQGIEIISFGSYLYHLVKVSQLHPFHSKPHGTYKAIFAKLPNKDLKLEMSKNSLEKRLSGEKDAGINYMKSSAFHDDGNNIFTIEKGKPAAIIFLHCFFDSPHIYNGSIFPDFYEWIIFILNIAAENQDTNYFIKPHPNGLPGNNVIIHQLQEDYKQHKNIIFIASHISNKQIIDQKPDAIFTVYGTVAHEFAYAGFPVITAGDNPHINYEFLYNPDSVEKMSYYLTNIGEYGLPFKYDKKEILEFFYMHYMYYAKKFDQSNMVMEKSFQTGKVSIPANESTEDLTYDNYII